MGGGRGSEGSSRPSRFSFLLFNFHLFLLSDNKSCCGSAEAVRVTAALQTPASQRIFSLHSCPLQIRGRSDPCDTRELKRHEGIRSCAQRRSSEPPQGRLLSLANILVPLDPIAGYYSFLSASRALVRRRGNAKLSRIAEGDKACYCNVREFGA